MKRFLIPSLVVVISCLSNICKAQPTDNDSFELQMNVITCDSSIHNDLYKYDFLDEKSLFIGYHNIDGLTKFEFINDIGAKIFVWPMDWIFFEEIPFWFEIDGYSIRNKKLTCEFHTKGIKNFKHDDFIEGVFVLEEISDGDWIIKFDKIKTYKIIY